MPHQVADPHVHQVGAGASLSLASPRLLPVQRILPSRPLPFAAFVVGLAAAAWLAGFALAPDKARFLASVEWRFMPVYLAAHFVALRLFVSTFTRSFRSGIAHLDVPEEQALSGLRTVLGWPGLALAGLVALPFVVLDFRYLTREGSRYERIGAGNAASAADYLMWSTWTVEWFINALIWVLLIGFLIKNCWVISRYPFRALIEIVVHERHYKPFLQMSAEGATIVLGFSAVTIFYLWYTGGELTDYAGLAITASLLFVGFVPP
jgi:hypothetical protein